MKPSIVDLPCTTEDLAAPASKPARNRPGRGPRVWKAYQPRPEWAIKQQRFDSGLDRLLQTRRPGQVFTQSEIARECGVSHQAIYLLERDGLKKAGRHLRRIFGLSLQEFFSERSGSL